MNAPSPTPSRKIWRYTRAGAAVAIIGHSGVMLLIALAGLLWLWAGSPAHVRALYGDDTYAASYGKLSLACWATVPIMLVHIAGGIAMWFDRRGWAMLGWLGGGCLYLAAQSWACLAVADQPSLRWGGAVTPTQLDLLAWGLAGVLAVMFVLLCYLPLALAIWLVPRDAPR